MRFTLLLSDTCLPLVRLILAPEIKRRYYDIKSTYFEHSAIFAAEEELKRDAPLRKQSDGSEMAHLEKQYPIEFGYVELCMEMLWLVVRDLRYSNSGFRESALAWINDDEPKSRTCITFRHLCEILNMNPTSLRKKLLDVPALGASIQLKRLATIRAQKQMNTVPNDKTEGESKEEK